MKRPRTSAPIASNGSGDSCIVRRSWGTSYAVISGFDGADSLGVFHACVNAARAPVRIVTKSSSCQKAVKHGKHKTLGELAVTWSQPARRWDQGINGTNGTNGIRGINGTDGTNGIRGINGTNGTNGTNAVKYWATITYSGSTPTVSQQTGGITAMNGETGSTDVTFPVDVSACAVEATLDGVGVEGFIRKSSSASSGALVRVVTENTAAVLRNSGFDIATILDRANGGSADACLRGGRRQSPRPSASVLPLVHCERPRMLIETIACRAKGSEPHELSRLSSELSGYASRSIAAVQVFAQLVTALGRPALTRLQGLDELLGRSKQPPVFRLAKKQGVGSLQQPLPLCRVQLRGTLIVNRFEQRRVVGATGSHRLGGGHHRVPG